MTEGQVLRQLSNIGFVFDGAFAWRRTSDGAVISDEAILNMLAMWGNTPIMGQVLTLLGSHKEITLSCERDPNTGVMTITVKPTPPPPENA